MEQKDGQRCYDDVHDEQTGDECDEHALDLDIGAGGDAYGVDDRWR